MAEQLRIVQGHRVRDRAGNAYGILDFNPDVTDPAVALAIDRGDGGESSSPVVRVGRVLNIGPQAWRAVEVQTAQLPVYLVLEAQQSSDVVAGDER
ncbi:hypothetical protein [uncultured Jatrophihabitans sp.]|uniref:hypothetical protein n=1 Tax=uncultured Jatrophihabitans sp. TaxID=1610747 RepID=UPI0035CC7E42